MSNFKSLSNDINNMLDDAYDAQIANSCKDLVENGGFKKDEYPPKYQKYIEKFVMDAGSDYSVGEMILSYLYENHYLSSDIKR